MLSTYYYLRFPAGRRLFVGITEPGETLLYPHPEGKRYAAYREDDGEVLIYAGRFHAIWSPRP